MSQAQNKTQADSETCLSNNPEMTTSGQKKSLHLILKEAKREMIEKKKEKLAKKLDIISEERPYNPDSELEMNNSNLKDIQIISPKFQFGQNIEKDDITKDVDRARVSEDDENVFKDASVESTTLLDVDISEQRYLPRLISPLSDSEVEDENPSSNTWDEFIRKYQDLQINKDGTSSDSINTEEDDTIFDKYYKPRQSAIFSKRIEDERNKEKIDITTYDFGFDEQFGAEFDEDIEEYLNMCYWF